MKLLGVSATGLFLLLGIPVPANAWQEQPEKQERPEKQEKKEQPAKPPKQEEQAKPEKRQEQPNGKQEQQRQQQDKSAKQEQQQQTKGQQEQQRQQQAKSVKQEQEQVKGRQEQQQKQQQQQDKSAKQEQRQTGGQRQQEAKSSQHPQRTQQEEARQRSQPELRLSARGNGRISDERFHSNFGREHAFRVGSPVLVGGYSRFQYGGYWFGFVEPWPADWYYDDDVYIDYVDGGYYMYNPYYPGTRFAVSVVI